MFGVSFGEIVLVAVVALVVVGPRRLPQILGTMGQWVGRLRRMVTEMRRQTGIDEILRAEGLQGGLSELRSMMRGETPSSARPPLAPNAVVDAYGDAVLFDRYRECPVEGADSYGAIPEDLVDTLAPLPEVNAPGNEPAPMKAPE